MFCPQCKTEYRRGFTCCTDCDVDLVEALPDQELSPDEELKELWWSDLGSCLDVCRDLKNADISYKVEPLPTARNEKQEECCYRILVSPGDLDRARAAGNLANLDEEEEVFGPEVVLPDAGSPLTAEPRRRDTYLEPFYPEDATVEVWSQDRDDLSSTIKLSLDANRIHCRCDAAGRYAKKIFVRPEDESFAREIVREIIEGTPLR
jgi:hypothetical protein